MGGTIEDSWKHRRGDRFQKNRRARGIEWRRIENSYNSGTVTGTSDVGGVAGSNKNTVTGSSTMGAVTGTSSVEARRTEWRQGRRHLQHRSGFRKFFRVEDS